MKLLVLGGTSFVGRHLTEAALAHLLAFADERDPRTGSGL